MMVVCLELPLFGLNGYVSSLIAIETEPLQKRFGASTKRLAVSQH